MLLTPAFQKRKKSPTKQNKTQQERLKKFEEQFEKVDKLKSRWREVTRTAEQITYLRLFKEKLSGDVKPKTTKHLDWSIW